jgi:hypothetical protein
MYVNCQPIVSPDPVIGSFSAHYDNTAGQDPASATVDSATLSFDMGQLVWTFEAMPDTVGPLQPGQMLTLVHQKVQDSGTGEDGPCGYCNGSMWQLTVQWTSGGDVLTDSLPAEPVGCVF